MNVTDADINRLLSALATTAKRLSPLAYYPVCGEDNEDQRQAAYMVVREWLVSVRPESQR